MQRYPRAISKFEECCPGELASQESWPKTCLVTQLLGMLCLGNAVDPMHTHDHRQTDMHAQRYILKGMLRASEPALTLPGSKAALPMDRSRPACGHSLLVCSAACVHSSSNTATAGLLLLKQ